jgi:hypothetical protein
MTADRTATAADLFEKEIAMSVQTVAGKFMER